MKYVIITSIGVEKREETNKQAEQSAMVSQVPVGRVDTIYARIGDSFAWLCVAGLLGAIAWVILHSRQRN